MRLLTSLVPNSRKSLGVGSPKECTTRYCIPLRTRTIRLRCRRSRCLRPRSRRCPRTAWDWARGVGRCLGKPGRCIQSQCSPLKHTKPSPHMGSPRSCSGCRSHIRSPYSRSSGCRHMGMSSHSCICCRKCIRGFICKYQIDPSGATRRGAGAELAFCPAHSQTVVRHAAFARPADGTRRISTSTATRCTTSRHPAEASESTAIGQHHGRPA